MKELNDNSIMPWGKFKGHTMENVPASYLLWCYENDKCCSAVKKYIIDNLDFLKLESNQ